jgi:hypothetical protein
MLSCSAIALSNAYCVASGHGSAGPRHPAELSTGALGGVLGLNSAP